ncbi:transglycosylase SLT domain-containing protein [Thalassobius sp. S69A]|uniref:lytic transglycosylase domain-containing protein n=1 Tax=unclassified Thalassovita TaxID=2619711 RepID=UPI000C650CCD|nr:tail length tape measure protein [Paracoccaceae bacterium]
MFRSFALILVICLNAAGLHAAGPSPEASAISAARAGNWDTAARLAARAGPVGSDLLVWMRLRSGQGSFAEVQEFLALHPDWPGLHRMRKRAEAQLETVPPAQIAAFFASQRPQTGAGVLAYARALFALGRAEAAQAELVRAWRTMDLDETSHEALTAAYGTHLAPHHQARMDMALWRGLRGDAQQMQSLVGEDWNKLAAARRGLRSQARNVDSLIEAVPAALRDDPGLAYERFQWRIRKGRTDGALDIILRRSQGANTLGQPLSWAGWRRYLVRDLMRDGRYAEAYQVASLHHTQPADGYAYSDLEWLSGYLSVRFLNAPERALDHFQRFRASVETPISLGRAGYWIGRAQEAMGDAEGARVAYAEGAAYQTSYYGLLAAERAGVPFDTSLAGRDPVPDWRQAAFVGSDVFQAGLLALNAGELTLAEQFLTHLASTLEPEAAAQLGQAAIDLQEPHLQVMIAKAAAKRGITLPAPYYALHPMQRLDLPVPMALALSIARRESEFDPQVVSGAGAMGLMQLMPGTAAQVAGELGVSHEPGKVLSDWSYNAVLGSAYLASLSERFGGNIVLVSAGYNAGPSRPDQWIERFGDPRSLRVDVVDWVEMIPFTETQNYVMRVAESLPVYRARLGLEPLPLPFSQELAGKTLRRP